MLALQDRIIQGIYGLPTNILNKSAVQTKICFRRKIQMYNKLIVILLITLTVMSCKTTIKTESLKTLSEKPIKTEFIKPEPSQNQFQTIPEKPTTYHPVQSGQIVKNVQSQGSCAIIEMTPDQAKQMALQRARSAAIEKALGIEISSKRLVTNGRLVFAFIQAYKKGMIVNEQREWLDSIPFQSDPSKPQIFEYRVQITADVYKPLRKIQNIGLKAKLNKAVFQNGEDGFIEIQVSKDVTIAIFNILSNDKIRMIFPNEFQTNNIIEARKSFSYEFTVQNLPGHKKDVESFYIVAVKSENSIDFFNMFSWKQEMDFTDFFKTYSKIVDVCEDVILGYEIWQ